MAPTEILLVCILAGLAIAITLTDLVLCMLRHRRTARVRFYSSRLERAPHDEAVATVRREWIKRRLAAIQNASTDAPTQ